MVDLASGIDPARPADSAEQVGQQIGDEFAQIVTRFVTVRLKPLVDQLADEHGPEVARGTIAAFVCLVRSVAEQLER